MSKKWVRYRLTAEFLSDAHLGSGSGGGGIDALIARDRYDRPIIWASHVEGVLRDAARRLRGDEEAGKFFGRAGGEQQSAVFTSLYAKESPESHIWCSTAREGFEKDKDFYNRAPQDDTLRVIEYVPKGTKLVGEVELPADDLPTLQRLVQEVDALGGGRSAGAGRVNLSLSEITTTMRKTGAATGRLVLLLKNRDPLCITATATPDNLIPSLAFVPGRALLGAVAAWLIAEGDRATASLLTSGKVSVSDALPLPAVPAKLDGVEVLPSPLSLQSEKPTGAAGDVPWWAQPTAPAKRLNTWSDEAESKRRDGLKLKRPEDDLFVYRASPSEAWTTFKPARRMRLRNGRPDPKQVDASLFAIEQIVEETHFLAELHGSPEHLKKVAEKLAPVLEGRRWLRVGRAGAPVEVAQLAWVGKPAEAKTTDRALLTLTSDLLVRDKLLRWQIALDEKALRTLVGTEDIDIVKTERGGFKELQDSVMVHGFNGTSRLWRMPAAAIRRGSVFEVSGAGVAKLAERAAKGEWLGERTHEGFGRFRIDGSLPGMTGETPASNAPTSAADIAEEAIAAKTQEWFNAHKSLAKSGGGSDRKPSLSQWLDLVGDLERGDANALTSRLTPTTAGGKSWKHNDAKAILDKLNDRALQPKQRALHARLFVRWLRADMRKKAKEAR
ncbi:MAG TPA: RAMP superfamily CRISPR-associated protein [Gemmataceae bacterium]|nr:RAMP superfamily CRISPR-associated protein [Gemmataceae bacterium]